jgi:putative transcription factor
MECEVCGKPIWKPHLVKIEGAQMKVCDKCAKFGVESRLPEGRRKLALEKMPYTRPVEIPEFVEGYGRAIREAREAMGLSREKLGEKISVKASVIARLESERMTPDISLAKKLERELGIRLLERQSPESVRIPKKPREELTLGDIVKIKKKG